MARSEFLVFGAPRIEQAEIDEVVDSLRSGWIGMGPKVARFEQDFAAYKGVERAVAVSSCTAALHLALICAGIGEGDEVITTPLTFASTVNTILYTGATPIFADVDPRTANIDPDAIEAAISPRTKAILPVHFAGRLCDMDRIMALAECHGLKVIEDCAHAVETRSGERPAGTFGDFGCFSFYATKNVAAGEGGMVIARNPEDLERVNRLRLHGLSRDAWNRFGSSGYRHYDVVECGYKYNMTDVQAALGVHQLARVDESWKQRRALWRRYQAAFEDAPVIRPEPTPRGGRHAYHLYTVLIDEARCGIARDAFLEAMIARKIGVGVHYLSLTAHPFYQRTLGVCAATAPHAARIGAQTVSLPLSPKMSDTDAVDVIDAVNDVLRAARTPSLGVAV